MLTKQQKECPYCHDAKRIRDELVAGISRQIIEIKNGNELWCSLILHRKEYRAMKYISYCPMCGRKLV